jgi:hypothetical protein
VRTRELGQAMDRDVARPHVGGALLLVAVLVALTAALVAASTAAPTAAWAQTPATLGTTAAIGHERGANANTWTLVEVTSSPSVPIAGQLEVRTSGPGGRAAATRDLEVAAGATKVLHLLLPPAEQVQVLFVPADGGDRMELPTGGSRNRGAVLVGALRDAPALPDPLSTAGTDRPVRGVAVDPAVLALGARALEGLDALLIDQAELAAASESQLAVLETAVVAGLDLLVSVAPGRAELPLRWDPVDEVVPTERAASITPAPAAWPLTLADLGEAGDEVVAAAVPAGRGRVVALGLDGAHQLATSDAVWRAVLQPRAELPRELGGGDEGDLGSRLFGGATSLPGARGAALFLLAFLVLVGPVNALVVRRLGRRELSWVTIPAIALLFTGVAAVTTTGGGSSPSPVIRAAWWFDGVGQEVTAVALQSPGRGVQQVSFSGSRDAIIHQPWGSVVGTSERVGDTTVLGARLEALQAVTAVSWGRPGNGPPLEVTAAVNGHGELDLDIANTAGVDLDDVRVEVATHRTEVGSIAAGDTRRVTIDDLGDGLPASRFGGGGRMFGGPPRAAPDPGPGAASRLLGWGPLDGSPGTVWVTAHAAGSLGLGTPEVGGGIEDRGSFVAVGVVPQGLDGAPGVAPHLVRRDLLRTDDDWMGWRPEPLTLEGQEEVVLRFRLPDPAARGELVSTLERGGPIDQGMVMNDPWAEGCFEVTEFDELGEQVGDPEERCGLDVACPPESSECGGDDRQLEACFPDGRCHLAVRIDEAEPEEVVAQDGFEVYDHESGGWVPATTAFEKGADTGRILSPLGEVLVRARQVGWFEFAQRGLAVAPADGGVVADGVAGTDEPGTEAAADAGGDA